jgi:hypothetical protein
VRELLARIDSAELTEWMAYERLEPFGGRGDDLRIGSTVAAIYNVNRDSQKHPDGFAVADVFPWVAATVKPAEVPATTGADFVAQFGAQR